jgi:hypothetical protein
MKPYSSLYPTSKKQKTKSSGDDTDTNEKPEEIDGPKGDVMVWKLVEQALEEGTLEQLRNSKNREEIPGAPSKKGSNSRAAKTKDKDAKTKDTKQTPLPKKAYAPLDVPKNRREARAAAREADEDSDGGFFE